MTSAPLRSVRLAMAIVLIAVVNFIAGRLGLLLAIPPGYATAVFPPAHRPDPHHGYSTDSN